MISPSIISERSVNLEIDEDVECPKCDEKGDGKIMIGCDSCDYWYHYECVGLDQSYVDEIESYFCDICRQDDMQIVWKRRQANTEQKNDKRKNYFKVEKILNHRGKDATRKFLVQWKDYSEDENSWEPEANMDGCIDILQDYLLKKKLPLSRVPGLVGRSSKQTTNMRNWISIDVVMSEVERLKNIDFKDVNIPLFFGHYLDKTGIYFVRHESHCFVVLYYEKNRVAFIADGDNLYRRDSETSNQVRILLDIKRIRSCRYDQQVKVDHCGSSAILIALEFIRAFKWQKYPKLLSSSNRLRERLVKRLHHFKSKQVKGLNILNTRLVTKCNKSYRTSKRKGYLTHIKWCKICNTK